MDFRGFAAVLCLQAWIALLFPANAAENGRITYTQRKYSFDVAVTGQNFTAEKIHIEYPVFQAGAAAHRLQRLNRIARSVVYLPLFEDSRPSPTQLLRRSDTELNAMAARTGAGDFTLVAVSPKSLSGHFLVLEVSAELRATTHYSHSIRTQAYDVSTGRAIDVVDLLVPGGLAAAEQRIDQLMEERGCGERAAYQDTSLSVEGPDRILHYAWDPAPIPKECQRIELTGPAARQLIRDPSTFTPVWQMEQRRSGNAPR